MIWLSLALWLIIALGVVAFLCGANERINRDFDQW